MLHCHGSPPNPHFTQNLGSGYLQFSHILKLVVCIQTNVPRSLLPHNSICKDMPCAASDLPSTSEAVLTAHRRGEEKPRPTPREERGKKKGKRREERNGPGNSGPRIPKNPRRSLQTERRNPGKHANTLTEFPKTLRKHDPKKSRAVNEKAKEERTLLPRGFGGRRQAFLQENFHDKTPPPRKQSSSPKTLHKKTKTDRTLKKKKRQDIRESLQKKAPKKKEQHFPLIPIQNRTRIGVGKFRGIQISEFRIPFSEYEFHSLTPVCSILHSVLLSMASIGHKAAKRKPKKGACEKWDLRGHRKAPPPRHKKSRTQCVRGSL